MCHRPLPRQMEKQNQLLLIVRLTGRSGKRLLRTRHCRKGPRFRGLSNIHSDARSLEPSELRVV
jgi:hypothetical protein